MNETILRGICKKCEDEVIWRDDQKWELCSHSYSHIPVWFLSAKQITIVSASPVFWKWATEVSVSKRPDWALVEYVEKYPFLVAKILKDAEKKSKEENK